jgi:outer membrane protein OmpA-like peptidoglycan-associated protein
LKYILLVFICLFNFAILSYSQEVIFSKNIADASGAVEIRNSGKYTVQFTGDYGLEKDITMFPELIDVRERNSLFLRYVAPSKGYLTFESEMLYDAFQVVLFKENSDNILNDMRDGSAEIANKNLKFVKSNKNHSNLKPIYLKQGQVVLFMFNSSKKKTSSLELEITFRNEEGELNALRERKYVDSRHKFTPNTFIIQIRDSETNEPLIASINVKHKKGSNLYSASDIIFDNDTQTKLTIKCDAPAYFFADTNYTVFPDSTKTLVIAMRAVSIGKVLKIDRIEFAKGSAKLIPRTESILIRVKDFLILNSDVKIEIQGHVNNEGRESLKTKRLSYKRAKAIKKYFIASGLNKERMTAKGFGNEFPIFEEPKNDREQQANRRVEIKILN